MNTISTATLSQRPANAAAFDQTASTMFDMDAILTLKPVQLKMPRRDAYEPGVDEVIHLSDKFARSTPALEWIQLHVLCHV